MSTQTSKKLAMSLLVVSMLALLVGVFNAVRLAPATEKTKSAEAADVSSFLSKKDQLALISVEGPISMDMSGDGGFFQSESNAVQARKALDKAAKDKSIKGVLLRVNSPGGTVGMSQELNAAVQRVSKEKPVVVSMGDVAASGGYYTACAADKIVANAGTLTASIGVIISSVEFSELMSEKLGVNGVTIKSGKFKDLLSPYRKPRPEELALLQRLIDESYQDFINAVLAGRTRFITDPAEKARVSAKIKALADGRIVTGNQALEGGLVDKLGDLDAAYTLLDKIAKERFHLRGKERLTLQEAKEEFSLLGMLGLSPTGAKSSAGPFEGVIGRVPFSMRHPNQPLWIME